MLSDRKRVVIDVDAGCDDAFAIFVMLYAEKLGLVKIEAIVCTMGNTILKNVGKNVVRILELLGRTDIPIYNGAIEPIVPPKGSLGNYYGKDGFGDLEHETEPDVSIIKKEAASVMIRELVNKNPGEISLVCLGPLTNAALPMIIYDDFAANLKEIFILGGNHAATGNVSETSAEFNFWADPEGAYVVLKKAECLITIVTWEACLDTNITFEWRFGVLGEVKNRFIELLNRAEHSLYPEAPPDRIWITGDAFAVMAMLFPKIIIRQNQYNATVELQGSNTRGQVVLDHKKTKEPNVTIIEKINSELVKDILLKAANA